MRAAMLAVVLGGLPVVTTRPAAACVEDTVCRPAAGPCDEAEICLPDKTCPRDDYLPAGDVCRPASGVCDLEEVCNGTSALCPTDQKVPVGTVCRPAAGPCDLEEVCVGADACPWDDHRTSVCRPPAGACDVAEYCDGVSPSCPRDVLLEAGTVCRAFRGGCDVVDTCTGSSASCPDQVQPPGFVCRPSTQVCDPQEVCDGTRFDCPPDQQLSDGTPCSGGGECGDVCLAGVCTPQTCSGDGGANIDAPPSIGDASNSGGEDSGGCGCRVGAQGGGWPGLAVLPALGLLALLAVARGGQRRAKGLARAHRPRPA